MRAMNYLNAPCTRRDILEARNYLARTIISCVNALLAFVAAFVAFQAYDKFTKTNQGHDVLYAIAFTVGFMVLWYIIKIKPRTDLAKSEQACCDTPYEETDSRDY